MSASFFPFLGAPTSAARPWRWVLCLLAGVLWAPHAQAFPTQALPTGIRPDIASGLGHGLIKVWDHDHHWHHRGPVYDPWFDGFWSHGWFGGRFGWWWSAGGRRYWYDRPVYPYPPMESEVVVVEPPPPPVVIQQPPVIVQQPPVVVQQPPPPAAAQPPSAPPAVQAAPNTWYYCDNPAGYYPYVKSCATPFRAVQAH